MVYMILGTGFEPMEAIAPCDILRRGGVEVQLAGIGGTLIEAGHGVRVQADCRVEDLKLASTDMVILPGGLGGVHSILACDTAMNFIRLAYADGKYIAAICEILSALPMRTENISRPSAPPPRSLPSCTSPTAAKPPAIRVSRRRWAPPS